MARRASRTSFRLAPRSPRVDLLKPRAGGFTIVELLIVVVVIAILAAITIVAYNGITNRAKASVASSAAGQAAKKVMTYATVNADQYPAALSDAGVSDSGATFQYRVDNSSTPKTFCLTATTQNVSYYASKATAAPTAGACPGHGVNGGGVITNLVTRPQANSLWIGHWGSGGTGARGVVSDSRFPGGTAYELTWTTAPTSLTSLYVGPNIWFACPSAGTVYAVSARYSAAVWSGMNPSFYSQGTTLSDLSIVDLGSGVREARALLTTTASCTGSLAPVLSISGSVPTTASSLRGHSVVGAHIPTLPGPADARLSIDGLAVR